MIERYWSGTGGTLFLEFPLVKRSTESSHRYLDGLIIPNAANCKWQWGKASADGLTARQAVTGKHIIVVQAKHDPERLSMPLMGQTFFAVELLKSLEPTSIRGVALCRRDDAALREVLESFPNMKSQ